MHINLLKIQNFGKIESAEIKLSPFTVVTGPNASGKSFVTRGLYSILHTLNQDMVSVYLINKLNSLAQYIGNIHQNISWKSSADEAMLDAIDTDLTRLRQNILMKFDFASLLKSQELLNFFSKDLQNLTSNVQSFVKTFESNKEVKRKSVQENLEGLLAELQAINSGLSRWVDVYTELLNSELNKAFLENFQIQNLQPLKSKDITLLLINDGKDVQISIEDSLKVDANQKFISYIQEFRNVVYLESPIYFKLRKPLKDARLQNMGLLRKGALNQVPKYFYDLDELISADLPGNISPECLAICDKIEGIIQGKLSINPRGDIVYQESGREQTVSLNMTSSGVSNLGMIALLLRRNVLAAGSLLFIDEPELNLHTSWQHFMTEVLCDLSKAGINVLIATHSLDLMHRLEYLVSQESIEFAEQHFSINQLNQNGRSQPRANSVLEDIYAAKQVLGEPFIQLLEEQLPNA